MAMVEVADGDALNGDEIRIRRGAMTRMRSEV